ncbi:hypothetical protein ABT160_32930 [Streptomyces sp. NPDC001941]|uniref:hypothetical protein n=1 Tax=Streptomyces sp. NPDC001941 TaxID=3154659 RepID=UPI003321AF39
MSTETITLASIRTVIAELPAAFISRCELPGFFCPIEPVRYPLAVKTEAACIEWIDEAGIAPVPRVRQVLIDTNCAGRSVPSSRSPTRRSRTSPSSSST